MNTKLLAIPALLALLWGTALAAPGMQVISTVTADGTQRTEVTITGDDGSVQGYTGSIAPDGKSSSSLSSAECEKQLRAVFDELRPAAETVLKFLEPAIEFRARFAGVGELTLSSANYAPGTAMVTAGKELCAADPSTRRRTMAHELGHAISFAQKRHNAGVVDYRGLAGSAYRIASRPVAVSRGDADPYQVWAGKQLSAGERTEERVADALGGAILRVAGERLVTKGHVDDRNLAPARWEMFHAGFQLMNTLDLTVLVEKPQMKVQQGADGKVFLRRSAK